MKLKVHKHSLLNMKEFSLYIVFKTSYYLSIASSSSQSLHHNCFHYIIITLIILPYYFLSEVSTVPTIFHVGCRPSPLSGRHHISSKPSHWIYPGSSWCCHSNIMRLLPSYHHIQNICFVLQKKKKQTTKAYNPSTFY